MVAWLLKCNISRLFFMNFKIFLQTMWNVFLVFKTDFLSECPFHTLGPVRSLFSSIHHYIIFLWLQRSIGQPKVIFLQIKKKS